MKVLVVEDHEKWQRFHKGCLDSILGEGNVDIVGNYQDAISLLDRKGNDYMLYIIDWQFPIEPNGIPRVTGTKLVEEIGRKKGFDKIVVVSSEERSLFSAQKLGVDKLYNKHLLNSDPEEVKAYSLELKSFLLG